jgi:hypothetical protein
MNQNTRFDCPPVKAALAGAEAISASLSSGEESLAGAVTAMGTCTSGGEALAGAAHPVPLISFGPLPFAKNSAPNPSTHK